MGAAERKVRVPAVRGGQRALLPSRTQAQSCCAALRPRPRFQRLALCFQGHGAPALPVLTLYVNSVKLRLVMGVYSFVFGWKLSLFLKTKQFWSVPFVDDKKRKKYLDIVRKDIITDLIS